MIPNEFFSYAIQEDNEGYFVIMYDLNREAHEICFTKNKKLAEYLEKHFDNLAMDEEKELFDHVL